MGDAVSLWWQPWGTLLAVLIALAGSLHVVLKKRDVRSAVGWVGLLWLVPLVGGMLYLLLGINRIRRRAVALRRATPRYAITRASDSLTPAQHKLQQLGHDEHLAHLSTAIGAITSLRLLTGNRVQALVNGDAAYPAMLRAIAEAQSSVALATYIFETGPVGRQFVAALAEARARGVVVRVLIDAVGARYAAPRPDRVLRRNKVKAALFMPAFPVWRAPYFNLRNHRKLLVVDGKLAFTGGVNIREGHVITNRPAEPIRDLHFRLEGPVVTQLQEVFVEDWEFTTREVLEGDAWFPAVEPVGTTLARRIADGPDADMDKIIWALLAALACARDSVLIMSPYFLPDTALNTALSTAALRGVQVHVVLPQRGNLTLVQWAMWRQLEEVLGHGVRVWLSPAPFDHTKLMLVDGEWALIGSANWDSRSLRLNFELNVECYDRELTGQLTRYVQARMADARELTLAELCGRPYLKRVRDGFARLLMPYL